jgi:hypothetical protein
MKLFKVRSWRSDVLPLMAGAYEGLNVELKNVPCRTDEESNEHRYRYSNFGFEFITELHKQLGKFAAVHNALQNGESVSVSVSVGKLPPISVRVSGKPPESKRAYYSDLADALLDAFEKQGFKA